MAKSLGTTTEKLRAAIKSSATARIDAALTAGEITSDEATTLKDALADGNLPAVHLATAAGVAKELGTTEAKLNTAYSDAQKAQAKARVDQAVTDGKITEAYATQLKAQIDAATFPGFGAGPAAGPAAISATAALASVSASVSAWGASGQWQQLEQRRLLVELVLAQGRLARIRVVTDRPRMTEGALRRLFLVSDRRPRRPRRPARAPRGGRSRRRRGRCRRVA